MCNYACRAGGTIPVTSVPAGFTFSHSQTAKGGGWHKASVSDCLPLAAPIGLSPLLILTLCGPERVLVVSTEPLDDLFCLTTPGSAVPETGGGGGWLRVRRGHGVRPSPCGGKQPYTGYSRQNVAIHA